MIFITRRGYKLMVNKDMQKLYALAWVEWRLRQQSTFLGFLWTMFNPALMFSVLYVVFVKWMGNHQNDYALFLIIGIVEWNFFSSSTSYTLTTLQRRAPLLQNYPLKPEIAALASTLSGYYSHLLELAALAILLIMFGGRLHASWLWLIPLDILYLSLVAGTSMLLACLYIFFMDLDRIWGIILMAGFFMTPIFFPLSVIEPARRRILELNPITAIIETARLAFSGGTPHPQAVLCAALWALAALAAGFCALRLNRARIGDAL